MRMLQRILAGIGTAALAATLTIGSVLPAQAAGTTGSLTITPQYDSEEIPAASYDGTFRIYKVADYDLTGTFTKTTAFENYTGEISAETLSVGSATNQNVTSQQDKPFRDLTEGLAGYVNDAENPIKPDKTVRAGTIEDLEFGLYLVMQDSVGTEGYGETTPFLAMIPAYGKDSQGNGLTNYNPVAYAKLPLSVPSNITSADPPVRKIVTGNPPSAATFTFVIQPVAATNPMPQGADGEVRVQVTTNGTKEAEFGNILFTAEGDYAYTIEEVNDGLANYTYDTTRYTLTYHVTVVDGVPTVTRTIVASRDGSESDITASNALVFTNSYSTPSTPGNTPDDDGGSQDEGGDETPVPTLQTLIEEIGRIVEGGNSGDAGIADEIGSVTEYGGVGGATGDNSLMSVYGSVAGVAAVALIGWFLWKRRRRA